MFQKSRAPYWKKTEPKNETNKANSFYAFPDDMPPAQRLVYLFALHCADKEGLAIIPRVQVSTATGFSSAAVNTAVTGLERSGLLVRYDKIGKVTRHLVKRLEVIPVGDMGLCISTPSEAPNAERRLINALLCSLKRGNEGFLSLTAAKIVPSDFENPIHVRVYTSLIQAMTFGLQPLDEVAAGEDSWTLQIKKIIEAETSIIDCRPVANPRELIDAVYETAIRRRAGGGGECASEAESKKVPV